MTTSEPTLDQARPPEVVLHPAALQVTTGAAGPLVSRVIVATRSVVFPAPSTRVAVTLRTPSWFTRSQG